MTPRNPSAVRTRGGIYIASKTKHAARWQALKASGVPIISTWIDEASEGETSDFADLWNRCIRESATCGAMIVYCEPGDVLKGAWLEMGVALNAGVPVFGVGLEAFTIAKSGRVQLRASLDDALAKADALIAAGVGFPTLAPASDAAWRDDCPAHGAVVEIRMTNWRGTARWNSHPDWEESRFPNEWWDILHYNGEVLVQGFRGGHDLRWRALSTPS